MNTNFEKTARKVSKIRKNRTPQQPPANTFYKSISNHIGNNKLRYGVGATLPLTASAGYLLSENKDTFNDPEFKKVRNDILAGSISGAISGAAVHPVDNWVVGLQSGKDSSKKISLKNNLKSLGGKVVKTTAAAGIGYPAYMYASRALSDDKEKTASYTENSERLLISMRGFSDTMEKTATPIGAAVAAARLVRPLKAAWGPIKRFTSAFTGFSRTPLTGRAAKAGTGASVGSGAVFIGDKTTKIQKSTTDIKKTLPR